ncbi:mechanosensitive ion channel family protein [Pseudalkalibacillus caeni]|uniref:Mechanosensitive ion channel family protein n=1 Tax=Exobacillus caeni TaxID=2574798 RepID=A0A5R9F0D6_9BACL|nr:mechanosensitive ion channel family protein [Pseudalkalibacillus caeni]TLS37072.1 mechanosensitive ion channel family protein [Pseudalkalibacillus caeni]
MTWEFISSYETLKNLGISIGIFLLFLVFRKLFTKYIFQLILRLSNKTPTEFFTYICLAFEKPIRWLFLIIGIYVSAKYFPFMEQKNPLFLNLVRSAVIIIITWGLYNLSSSSSLLFTKVNERFNIKIDQILIPFFSKALRFIIIAISFSIIAQEFDYDVNGFVAGLGLGGLAFALAAKDALANLFGGIVIITEKPFSIGEWIMTPSVEGTVEDINFRSTRVRTFDQAVVTVPNATLANESITNWSKMGKRRITFNLGLTYDTPKEKIERVTRKIDYLLRNHEAIHKDTIFATFDKYNDSSLDIFLYFFTKTTVWAEFLKVKEEINFKIMDILEEEGVSVAFPSRTLYVSPQTESFTQAAASMERDEQ